MMEMAVSGTVIVTGAFGALGKAVCAGLAARGFTVAAIDIAPAAALPGAALVIGQVDLADEAAVERAYAGIAQSLGGLDGLVNVAGGFVWAPVEGGDLAEWDRMYRTNLHSAAASCRAAIGLFGGKGGAIVNIGAAAASGPGHGMAAYAASKAGVRALTESLADELKSRAIRVNAILPRIIDTPANRGDMPDADWSKWTRPEAIASVVAFLLSDDAASISGASLPVGAYSG